MRGIGKAVAWAATLAAAVASAAAFGGVDVQKARFGSVKANGSVVTNVVADAEITNVANKVARAMKMEKLGAYLWAMEAAHADWDVATNRLSKAYPSYKPFGCTGVHAGRFHGRNLDWTFDFGATVVMRSPASDGKYACLGIVEGAPGVTDDAVASGKWLAAYDSIPFTWADGINEYGVVAQQNVLQKRTDKSAAWRTNSVGKVICFAIIRYALDRCSSAYEAANLINSKVFIPSEYAYDFHYLVSDATSAYVVEDGKVVANSAETPTDVMTNFRIDGILVGDDKTLDWNSVEPYGIGLERYDRIRQNGNDNATLAGMVATMKDVWYTKSYKVETSPYWYTEFCETGTERSVANAKSAPEVFYTVVTNERAIFEAEHESGASYRGGHTWQTTHMSVYDQQELTLRLWTQEDDGSEKLFYLFPDAERKPLDGKTYNFQGGSASALLLLKKMVEDLGGTVQNPPPTP